MKKRIQASLNNLAYTRFLKALKSLGMEIIPQENCTYAVMVIAQNSLMVSISHTNALFPVEFVVTDTVSGNQEHRIMWPREAKSGQYRKALVYVRAAVARMFSFSKSGT